MLMYNYMIFFVTCNTYVYCANSNKHIVQVKFVLKLEDTCSLNFSELLWLNSKRDFLLHFLIQN